MRFVLIALVVCIPFTHAHAAEYIVPATVLEVRSERVEMLPGMQSTERVQELEATLSDGARVSITNDRIPLSVGDRFYALVSEDPAGRVVTVHDVDRIPVLIVAVVLFALATIAVGAFIGLRALISLAISIAFILYGLVPLLGSGYPPLLVCGLGAAVILALAMLVTHGVHSSVLAAYIAAIGAVLVAIGLGEVFVTAAHLTGYSDSAAAMVSVTIDGINMQGLLLGAIIIGVLGIVDDLAITQVATVAELSASGVTSARELYSRAMHVGREHLGAVVNTLVLAYAGASLPLLMLFAYAPAPTLSLVNSEVIALEIVRAAIGGVALALVIPLATILAVYAQRSGLTLEGKRHT